MGTATLLIKRGAALFSPSKAAFRREEKMKEIRKQGL